MEAPRHIRVERGGWVLPASASEPMLTLPLPPEAVVAPEKFAETVCEDLGLPSDFFVPRVAAAIREKAKEADFALAINTQFSWRRVPHDVTKWQEEFATLLTTADGETAEALAATDGTANLETSYDLRVRIQASDIDAHVLPTANTQPVSTARHHLRDPQSGRLV